jgi:hypothetical protein
MTSAVPADVEDVRRPDALGAQQALPQGYFFSLPNF